MRRSVLAGAGADTEPGDLGISDLQKLKLWYMCFQSTLDRVQVSVKSSIQIGRVESWESAYSGS
jgi:hypothetical protein